MIYTICNIEKEKNKRINKSPPLPHQYSTHHIRNLDSIPLLAQPRPHIPDISYYHLLHINQNQTKHANDYSNNLID